LILDENNDLIVNNQVLHWYVGHVHRLAGWRFLYVPSW